MYRQTTNNSIGLLTLKPEKVKYFLARKKTGLAENIAGCLEFFELCNRAYLAIFLAKKSFLHISPMPGKWLICW